MGLLKSDIKKRFKHKGEKIIQKNITILENTLENLFSIPVPEHWANLTPDNPLVPNPDAPDEVNNIQKRAMALVADELPVSAFQPGGLTITDTCKYEKRGATFEVPIWIKDNCT